MDGPWGYFVTWKTNTTCFHLYVESKKKQAKQNKNSSIQRTDWCLPEDNGIGGGGQNGWRGSTVWWWMVIRLTVVISFVAYTNISLQRCTPEIYMVLYTNLTSINKKEKYHTFCRSWWVDPKIYMEMQKTYNNQNSFDKEQSWRTFLWIPILTIKLQLSRQCSIGIRTDIDE